MSALWWLLNMDVEGWIDSQWGSKEQEEEK